MTTTIHSHPDVPLPAGFVTADDWQASGPGMPYRFIGCANRTVTDHAVWVSMQAVQWADGSLSDGSGVEAPGIAVLEASARPLNSDQARELAAALLAAAAELDRLEAPR
jgi:hypothetical protein